MLREADRELAIKLGIIKKEDAECLKEEDVSSAKEYDSGLIASLDRNLASAKDSVIYMASKLTQLETELLHVKEENQSLKSTIHNLQIDRDEDWQQIRMLRKIIDKLTEASYTKGDEDEYR